MTEGQIVALVWGPFAIILGTYGIRFRHEVSARARAHRERQGMRLSPWTQSPLTQAIAGGFFVILGVLVIIGGATGVLH